MLQAEIAGSLVPSPEGSPAKGAVIHDFQLPASQGKTILLSEYRGRRNMVLVLAGESELADKLLCEVARHQPELNEDETLALAIVAGAPERAANLKRALHLNFEVLADMDARVHRSLGAEDRKGRILPAVFITDRFGEVFAVFNPAQGASLPGFEEIHGWIDLINRQCPECGPREWLD